MRPLTWIRAKALCPVGGIALVDHAIATALRHTDSIAVNVHHHPDQMTAHLDERVHVSMEREAPLGTAGAIGALRAWIDGRDLLIINADRYHPDSLEGLLDGWTRDDVRLLVIRDPGRGDFDDLRFTGASVMPWDIVRTMPEEPAGLWKVCWQPAREEGRLSFAETSIPFVDCGTPTDYHEANMLATGGASAIADDAFIEGEAHRSVVWPGARVRKGEILVDAIRATDELTVFVG